MAPQGGDCQGPGGSTAVLAQASTKTFRPWSIFSPMSGRFKNICLITGLPRWLSGKESTCQPMQETKVQSLGQKDCLEEEMAAHSSILDWLNPVDRGAWWATVHRVIKESDMT